MDLSDFMTRTFVTLSVCMPVIAILITLFLRVTRQPRPAEERIRIQRFK